MIYDVFTLESTCPPAIMEVEYEAWYSWRFGENREQTWTMIIERRCIARLPPMCSFISIWVPWLRHCVIVPLAIDGFTVAWHDSASSWKPVVVGKMTWYCTSMVNYASTVYPWKKVPIVSVSAIPLMLKSPIFFQLLLLFLADPVKFKCLAKTESMQMRKVL